MTLVAICLVIPQRMRISNTVTEIWPFEVFQGRLFQEQRSVGCRSSVSPQYYTNFIWHISSQRASSKNCSGVCSYGVSRACYKYSLSDI